LLDLIHIDVRKVCKLFNDATTFSGTKERGIKNVLDINYNYQCCLEDLSAIQLGTVFSDLPSYVTPEEIQNAYIWDSINGQNLAYLTRFEVHNLYSSI